MRNFCFSFRDSSWLAAAKAVVFLEGEEKAMTISTKNIRTRRTTKACQRAAKDGTKDPIRRRLAQEVGSSSA
jgi:hypothetical protein